MIDVVSIGVDPGSSCGLAILQNGKRIAVMQSEAFAVMSYLRSVLSAWVGQDADVHIFCERFTMPSKGRPRSQQGIALQIVGMVQHEAELLDYPCDLQSPSDAKSFASNALLRTLGIHVRPGDVGAPDADDANDAVRHALLGLARRHPVVYDDLLRRHNL